MQEQRSNWLETYPPVQNQNQLLLVAADDANVNAEDNYGTTELMAAARYEHDAIVEMLTNA